MFYKTSITSIADTGRLGTKLRNVLVYCFFCPVCASVMRGRTVYSENGRKETRGERKEKRGRKKWEGRNVKRGGRNEKRGGRKEKRGGRMDKRNPFPPPLLWYSVFVANS